MGEVPSFEIAAGSIPGRSHTRSGKPNQDACAFRSRGASLVAVVADGCGSGARSEVGAEIGARVVVEQVLRQLDAGARPDAALLERTRCETLDALAAAARAMGGDLEETVTDLLLFTVLGVVIAGGDAAIFGIGDGLVAIEGPTGAPVEHLRLGPFPGNAPPYLAYGLLGDGPRFTLHRALPAADLRAVLLGTDGAVDIEGPLSGVWRDDRIFRNRDAIRRRLTLLSREIPLEDDTTVLALRRKASAPLR